MFHKVHSFTPSIPIVNRFKFEKDMRKPEIKNKNTSSAKGDRGN